MRALGMIESVGMAAAVTAADTAVKSANVHLLGYELTKGGGMVMIKFEGDVGAVKAALEAGSAAAEQVSKVVSKHMIPRPGDGVEKMIFSEETVGPSSAIGTEHNKKTVQSYGSVDPLNQNNDRISQNQEETQVASESGEAELEDPDPSDICNLCKDPKCLRRKGDLKTDCLHSRKNWRDAR